MDIDAVMIMIKPKGIYTFLTKPQSSYARWDDHDSSVSPAETASQRHIWKDCVASYRLTFPSLLRFPYVLLPALVCISKSAGLEVLLREATRLLQQRCEIVRRT